MAASISQNLPVDPVAVRRVDGTDGRIFKEHTAPLSPTVSTLVNEAVRAMNEVAPASVEVSFEADALAWLALSDDPNTAYWAAMIEDGPEAMAPNLSTRAGVARIGNRLWPLTVDDAIKPNSYPCSLFTQYFRYPMEELHLVAPGAPRFAASAALHLLGAILRIGRVDRAVQWSSWLLSTNLHSSPLPGDAAKLTRALVDRFPSHAILIKNIHGYEDPTLPTTLETAGYELITSRQIYMFDGRTADFLSRSTVKRDLKELAKLRDYTVVAHDDFTEADAPRVTELYRQLYLEKHSFLNPQYTEHFVARAIRDNLMEFCGLRHTSGRLDAVFACFSRGRTTSTPFIGYDTSLPADLGLYRILVSLLLKRVAERKTILNYSSGAGDFKRRRGGQPVIETNAIYTRHLNPLRRAAIGLLGVLLNRFGRRFLEENEI